jgi:hypothetical protein
VVQYPSTHGGEKLLLLSRGNYFSPLPLAHPRVRCERHLCPSVRNAASSPLVPPCLASTVALLLAALVILDRHVHALPSPRMRAPPFAGSRPVSAALVSGEPLPRPIPARTALLGFVCHFFFWGSNFTSFSKVSVELPLFSYTDLESWRRSICQAPGRGLARA